MKPIQKIIRMKIRLFGLNDEVIYTDALSAKTVELAADHQLGELERTFVVPKQRWCAVLLRFIFFVILTPASMGLLMLSSPVSQINFFAIWAYFCLFLSEAGILTFFIAFKFTLPHYKRLRRALVAFFQHGFIC